MKKISLIAMTAAALVVGTSAGFAQVNLNTGASGNVDGSAKVRGNQIDTQTGVKSNNDVNVDRRGAGANSNTSGDATIKVNPNR